MVVHDTRQKSRAARKKTYRGASHPGERIFVDMPGPLPESLIGDQYWIDIVDNYSRYSWSFFTKTKSQLPKKMEYFFKNMTSRGTPVKYPSYKNAGEHQ